jgi:hypothetical protein
MSSPTAPDDENPYKPPAEPGSPASETPPFSFDDCPQRLRSAYGARESSVRTIGLFLYFLAALAVLNGAMAIASPRFAQRLVNRANPDVAVSIEGLRTVMVIASLVGAGLYCLLGFSLRRLHNWTRWAVILFMGFGILGLIQTMAIVGFGLHEECLITFCSLLFNTYVTAVLLRGSSASVFSRKYRWVVAQTPELAPKPSDVDRAFLGTAIVFYLGTFVIQLYRSL